MAELHVWTAERWRCPACPAALILCTTRHRNDFALQGRINEHLAEHRVLFQDARESGTISPHLHMVLTPPARAWDLKDPAMWDVARAVVGQVIDA